MSVPAQPAHRRAVMLMLVSVACFTANILLVRWLGDLHAGHTWLVSASRFLVGLAVIAAVYRREVRFGHVFRRRKLVERGVTGSLAIVVTYVTVVKLGAGRAVFINNTYIIWGALLAAWVLRETLRPSLLVGGVTALLGLALLVNLFATGSHPGVYDLLAVVGALFSAIVVVTIRQLHATEHSSTIFAAQCVYGLAITAVPALLTYAPLSPLGWALLVLAGLTAGVGQLAMTRSFRDLSVAEGSLLQILTPLGIAVGGMLFFGEHFSQHEVIGAALILGGSAFIALRR